MQQSKKFIDNINNIQASVDSGNLSDAKKFHPQDRVLQVVLPILPEARKKAGYLKDHLDATTKTFNDLLTYYGEDPADESSRKRFFRMIADFLKNYKVCSLTTDFGQVWMLISLGSNQTTKIWNSRTKRNDGRRDYNSSMLQLYPPRSPPTSLHPAAQAPWKRCSRNSSKPVLRIGNNEKFAARHT